MKKIADKKINIVLATDHGSVRVKTPSKVIGDKQTTTNLRYKHGRNLNYEPKDVLAFRDPKEAGLPVPTVNSSYIFAKGDGFLCYPNNYNYYVNYYRNTFQHGGVSLEEMIVPVIRMTGRQNPDLRCCTSVENLYETKPACRLAHRYLCVLNRFCFSTDFR